MLSKLDCPFEVKAADEAGNFEGYAAVFDNVDLGDDVILKGAFTRVKTARNGRLKLALYHDLTRLVVRGRVRRIPEPRPQHRRPHQRRDQVGLQFAAELQPLEVDPVQLVAINDADVQRVIDRPVSHRLPPEADVPVADRGAIAETAA